MPIINVERVCPAAPLPVFAEAIKLMTDLLVKKKKKKSNKEHVIKNWVFAECCCFSPQHHPSLFTLSHVTMFEHLVFNCKLITSHHLCNHSTQLSSPKTTSSFPVWNSWLPHFTLHLTLKHSGSKHSTSTSIWTTVNWLMNLNKSWTASAFISLSLVPPIPRVTHWTWLSRTQSRSQTNT